MTKVGMDMMLIYLDVILKIEKINTQKNSNDNIQYS
jgi:hypothetical protein